MARPGGRRGPKADGASPCVAHVRDEVTGAVVERGSVLKQRLQSVDPSLDGIVRGCENHKRVRERSGDGVTARLCICLGPGIAHARQRLLQLLRIDAHVADQAAQSRFLVAGRVWFAVVLAAGWHRDHGRPPRPCSTRC
jgi:hypothetical protein